MNGYRIEYNILSTSDSYKTWQSNGLTENRIQRQSDISEKQRLHPFVLPGWQCDHNL